MSLARSYTRGIGEQNTVIIKKKNYNLGPTALAVQARKAQNKLAKANRAQMIRNCRLSDEACTWKQRHDHDVLRNTRWRKANKLAGVPDPSKAAFYCCAGRCCATYSTQVVRTLRGYFQNLSPADQRTFIKHRVVIKTTRKRMREDEAPLQGDLQDSPSELCTPPPCKRRQMQQDAARILQLARDGVASPLSPTISLTSGCSHAGSSTPLRSLSALTLGSQGADRPSPMQQAHVLISVGNPRQGSGKRQYHLDDSELVQADLQGWANHRYEVMTEKTVPSNMMEVCETFFVWALGTNRQWLHKDCNRSDIDNPQRHVIENVPRKKYTCVRRGPFKRNLIITTLLEKAKREAIVMPDRETRVLLSRTQHEAYKEMELELREKGFSDADIPRERLFNTVWLHEPKLQNICTRRTIPFSKCDVCFGWDDSIEKTSDQDFKDFYRRQKALHLKGMYEERSEYYMRKAKAELFPDKYMSLIIDAMDNSSNRLPSHPTKTHLAQSAWKFKTHVFGCLSHGQRAYAYVMDDKYKMGHNSTIQVLHNVLLEHKTRTGKLPPTLFLQLDNTTKQCKGQYLLGYLTMLVDTGVFEKIIVSFLPVGHTHEDIDQFFSRLKIKLSTKAAYTREELLQCIREAWGSNAANKNMSVKQICAAVELDIANISDWLKDKGLKLPKGVTYWRQFRIKKVHGRTAIQARHNTVHARWGNICEDESHDGLYSYAFPGEVPRLTPRTAKEVPPGQIHLLDQKSSIETALGRQANAFLAPQNAQQLAQLTRTTLTQYQSMITILTKHYSLEPHQVADLQLILERLSDNIPPKFAWADEDILLLYGPTIDANIRRVPTTMANGQPLPPDAYGQDIIQGDGGNVKPEVGSFCMYKAATDDENYPLPFVIAECMLRAQQPDPQHVEDPDKLWGGAHMRVWVPKNFDTWETSAWSHRTATSATKKNAWDYTFQFDQVFECDIHFVGGNKNKLSVKSKNEIKFYMDQWAHGNEAEEGWESDNQSQEEEAVNSYVQAKPKRKQTNRTAGH